jgi:toxin CcdB
MARFDVYRNADPASARTAPFLVDVQHELFDDLATRVVVPLFHRRAIPRPLSRLEPEVEVAGQPVVMATTDLAGVPRRMLGERVGALPPDVVSGAIDFLLHGI